MTLLAPSGVEHPEAPGAPGPSGASRSLLEPSVLGRSPADRRLTRLELLLCVLGGSLVVAVGVSLGLVEGILAMVVAAGFAFTVTRPVVLGYLLVAIVPITSGVARGVPVPGLRISEALIVAGAAVVLVRTAGDRDRRWQWIDWVAFGFVGLHVALSLLGGVLNDALTSEGMQLVIGPVQYFLLFRVVRATLQTPAERRTGLRLLMLATIPVSILAIAQYVGVPGAQELVEQITRSGVFDLWTYSQQPRATGPFESWHPLAGYLFLPICVGIALLAEDDRSVMSRSLTFLVLAIAGLALLVSQTLNVLAGLAMVAVVIAVVTGRFMRILAPLAAVAAIGALVFGPVLLSRVASQESWDGSGGAAPQTLTYRMEVWTDQYLPAIAETWMTGYGPEIPPSIEWRSTESLYFTLMLRGGVVLLVTYAALVVVAVAKSWAVRRSPDGARRVAAVALIGSAVALVPMQAVFPYFTASGMPQVWWILLAFVAGSSSARLRARTAETGADADVDRADPAPASLLPSGTPTR
jgi:hypothetical protein